MDLDALGRWLGWLLMAGYAALTLTELPRYFKSALDPIAETTPVAQAPVSWRRLLCEVLAAFVASRLLVVLVCATGFWIQTKDLSGFFDQDRHS